MRAFLFLIVFFGFCQPIFATNPFSHDAFDRVLRAFVNDAGLVNYQALKKNQSDLASYVELLGKFSPENAPEQFPTEHHRLAYWINAYNALAISAVVDAYPVKSVREIKWFYGFFNRINHVVGGKTYTLKEIEHDIIRQRFGEPRIHAGLNCASMGCPRLPRGVYWADTLENNLEKDMRTFVRESRNVRIDQGQKRLHLSEIFREFEEDFTSWYQKRFDRNTATMTDYLQLYLDQTDVAYLKEHPNIDIKYIKYDWRLNDQALAQ